MVQDKNSIASAKTNTVTSWQRTRRPAVTQRPVAGGSLAAAAAAPQECSVGDIGECTAV